MFNTPLAPPKILVFDSGAGGLTIAKEILAFLPCCQLFFAADKAYFPYGLKQDCQLTQRIIQQVEYYHQIVQPDLVVVACNTASTLALDTLRKEFSCPFVGVVPAIKPAAQMSRTGTIGVLATPATVARAYTHKLIDDFAQDHTVLLQGSDKLVSLAEEKIHQGKVNLTELSSELALLFSQPRADEIDTVVLACTHFPILKEDMNHIATGEGKHIAWVDSGNAIARRVYSLLENAFEMQTPSHHIEILITGNDDILVEKKYRAFLTPP